MVKPARAVSALETCAETALSVTLVLNFYIIAALSSPPSCVVDSSSGVVKAPDTLNIAVDAHVRTFPLLTKQESEALIFAAEAAASTRGWNNRYAGTDLEQYGTTDLEVRKVPELWSLVEPHLAKAVIGAKTALVSAKLENLDDIDFRDIFLVRYSSEGQRMLGAHEDGSVATFQVALNQAGVDFDEGGTFFEALGCRLQPRVGEAHTFPGHIRHQGLEITRGRRYILVGFYKGYRQDDEHVGLSFGSEYKLSFGPIHGDRPCLEHRSHGRRLFAKVSWWGCADDSFALTSHLGSQGGDVQWMWVERRALYNCEQNKTRYRILRLPQDAHINFKSANPSLLALPPGHQYNALKLDDCFAAH